MSKFILKLVARIILNAGALYGITYFLPGFTLEGNLQTFIVAALVLAGLYTFVRPLVKILTFPLVWLSFGLFNIVISVLLLWGADQLLISLSIEGFVNLLIASVAIGLINSIF